MVATERVTQLAERWRQALAQWTLPADVHRPPNVSSRLIAEFARRADRQVSLPESSLLALGVEALAGGGTILDVGAGAGAASIPLAPYATHLTAVDAERAMLDELARRAAVAKLPVTLVQGRWPDVAEQVPSSDLVLCAHVLYNVDDLPAFVGALSDHARRRVIYVFTERHPRAHLTVLWERFYGLKLPESPNAEDAIELLRALDLDVHVER